MCRNKKNLEYLCRNKNYIIYLVCKLIYLKIFGFISKSGQKCATLYKTKHSSAKSLSFFILCIVSEKYITKYICHQFWVTFYVCKTTGNPTYLSVFVNYLNCSIPINLIRESNIGFFEKWAIKIQFILEVKFFNNVFPL